MAGMVSFAAFFINSGDGAVLGACLALAIATILFIFYIQPDASDLAPHRSKLDQLLEGRSFLLGETLSLADITAGTSLYRYFELQIERPKLPQVERWYRTLQQREGYRTHIMIPFGELRGRLDY